MEPIILIFKFQLPLTLNRDEIFFNILGKANILTRFFIMLMKFNNSDLLLYFMHLSEKGDRKTTKYTKDEVARAFHIKPSSVDVYLSKLSSNNYIYRKKRHFTQHLLETIDITYSGRDRINTIKNDLNTVIFTPERHSIQRCIKFNDFSKDITDPLDYICLLSMYNKKYNFDLLSFLSNINFARDDSNIHNFFLKRGNDIEKSFISALYNMSLYGDLKNVKSSINNSIETESINALIILAETESKKGKFEKAELLYKTLLSPDLKLSQYQWFLTNIGLINVYRKKENSKKVMNALDDFEKQTKDKIFLAYIKQIKALEIGIHGQYEESIKMFSSVISSFHNFGFPLLIDIGYANRGFVYFLNKKYDLAEKDWKTAKKYAIEAKSKYSVGKNLGNLADIEILKGNFETAERFLDEAESIFNEVEDVEGLMMIAYNRGLFYLAKKDLKEALKQYEYFKEIGSPLPGPYLENILRNDFIERAKENGHRVKIGLGNYC
jgi:tetratricopeptide (TPR) repeat protein